MSSVMSVESEAQSPAQQKAAEMRAETVTVYGNIPEPYTLSALTLAKDVEMAFSFSLQKPCSFTRLEVALGLSAPNDPPAKVEAFLREDREDVKGTPKEDHLFTATREVSPLGGLITFAEPTGASSFSLLANTTYWLSLRSGTPGSTPVWYINAPGVVGPHTEKQKLDAEWEKMTSNNQGAFRIIGVQ